MSNYFYNQALARCRTQSVAKLTSYRTGTPPVGRVDTEPLERTVAYTENIELSARTFDERNDFGIPVFLNNHHSNKYWHQKPLHRKNQSKNYHYVENGDY